MDSEGSSARIAATLAAFVDTLLPGDDLFPPASATGTHGVLADRMRTARGTEVFAELAEALTLNGQLFDTLTPEKRVTLVQRLESSDPEFFSFLRMAMTLAYYATPPVVAAIRALGHVYNDSPQPQGYELPKFSFTPGVDIPMNPAGRFKWTFEMERLDLSSLADLELPIGED